MAKDEVRPKNTTKCNRCGETNPAEIHTCTPLDPLLEALRVPEKKREWVGLTENEILEEYRQSYGDDGNLTDVYFARAIEAKLKEKNT